MPVGAIAGSAVIGAGASIYSGNKAAKAQKNAAAQQAANERYFYDTTRADQAPYRDVGTGALSKLADMYGVPTRDDFTGYIAKNPDIAKDYAANVDKGRFPTVEDYARYHYDTYGQGEGRQLPGGGGVADYGGFTASPGYQFRMDEGQKAIERSMAARGLFQSGSTAKALTRFAQGTASDEFERYANALRSMAGLGQTSTQATSAAGSQAAGGISQAYQNAGNARASSYANTGASINNMTSNIMGAYLQGGFGGGGGGGFTPQPFNVSLPTAGIGAGGSVSSMMPSWYG